MLPTNGWQFRCIMQSAKRTHPPVASSRRRGADAQFRRGMTLQRGGVLARAVAAFASAIQLDSRHFEAHRARAGALTALGRHAEAVAAWEAVHALRPDIVDSSVQLGRALATEGRHEHALSVLGTAIQRNPGDPGLLMQMGLALLRLGRAKQAAGALLLAVEAAPEDAAILSALGIAFLQCDDLQQARACSGTAFQLAPGYDTAVNFSRVLLDAGAFEEALAVSLHAVGLRADSLPARNNNALALEGLGRHDDAVAAWRAALAIEPDNPDSHHKLATLLLSLGRMTPETWALYERRLERSAAFGSIRRWQGEDVAGKTVLLHAEQGLGDTLQFVRYAPLVAGRGARVLLVVQPGLTRLLACVPGVDQVIAVGTALPPFDVFCPLMSLPAIFQTTLQSIPPPLPYAPPETTRQPGVLRVGLAWAGNPGFVNDRRRSLSPALLAPLTRLDGVRCYSLQLGQAPSPSELCVSSAMEGAADFADTAARIAELDLVIAVDTAVAHLAATMGKPVWMLSRFLGCWRWLLDRSDSPWYPTMRIYRQSRANDWAAVIQRVERDLKTEAVRHGLSDAGSVMG